MKMFKRALCFDDVLLVPQKSEIMSRKDISLSTRLDKDKVFRLPVISSPMDTVTESEMAISMNWSGGLGIIHRYNTIEEQASLVRQCFGDKRSDGDEIIGAAIGVTGDYIDRAAALIKSGARVICIDVAHGHHSLMRHCLKTLRNTFGTSVHIMAGNVATLEATNDLADWGADSVRVGIGGGSICSTRIQTGHGIPTFQSIVDCSKTDRDVSIIADGGIRNSGDIVKALAAGADFVMLGSLLAGTDESPGDVIYHNGERCKQYRGMASIEAQIQWRGHTASVEGVSSQVPWKGSLGRVLESLETGIRSGFSYTGASSIIELHSSAKFITQTSAGAVESNTHIKNI
jgi:IMP dehydrogenase